MIQLPRPRVVVHHYEEEYKTERNLENHVGLNCRPQWMSWLYSQITVLQLASF